MSRSSELLKAAAGVLEFDRGDVFGDAFLAEHEVTFDECTGLADSLATGARLVAWAIENPRQAAAAVEAASISSQTDLVRRKLEQLL